MQIKFEQLQHHLHSTLAPVYLVSGDEPFLKQEAGEMIRIAAKAAGFTERKLFQGEDPEFHHLASGMQTMSLFAEKTIYEYRLDKLPITAAAKQLESWCENYQSDDLLILITPKIDKAGKQKKWVKAINQLGTSIDIFPISSQQFPSWFKGRADTMGINLTREALNILCQRTEGNLLAANQELQRLSLLAESSSEIDVSILREFTADNARFGQFELIDSCLNGESSRLVRMLHALREEGTNIIEITAPLNAEIRKLCRIAWEKDSGTNLANVYKQYFVWRSKQMVYNKALARYPLKVWQQLLSRLLILDKAVKGQTHRDAWLTLETLLLVIAGQKRFSKFISEAA